jgi:RNA polymerase sigma-70 factor, ECF subfamily
VAEGPAYLQPAMSRDADAADEELMLRYRDGDAGAFDELYRRHRGGLYRYLLRQCHGAAVAEELFQDIWMNLIRARSSYEATAKFTTWLYRLAHNRLIDHYRRDAHRAALSYDDEHGPRIDEPYAPPQSQPDASYDVRQQAAQLLSLLAELPEAQREAFVLQQESGMSVEEIAAVTGVSRETAKSRLRYAMARLRQGMKPWL